MRIDRLTLHTGPLTDAEAHELARLVAEDIAALPLPPAGSLRIQLQQPASSDTASGAAVATLREAIVRAVEAALTGAAPQASGRVPAKGGAS